MKPDPEVRLRQLRRQNIAWWVLAPIVFAGIGILFAASDRADFLPIKPEQVRTATGIMELPFRRKHSVQLHTKSGTIFLGCKPNNPNNYCIPDWTDRDKGHVRVRYFIYDKGRYKQDILLDVYSMTGEPLVLATDQIESLRAHQRFSLSETPERMTLFFGIGGLFAAFGNYLRFILPEKRSIKLAYKKNLHQ